MADRETHMPWEATRRALAGELAAIDGVLPGSSAQGNDRTPRSRHRSLSLLQRRAQFR